MNPTRTNVALLVCAAALLGAGGCSSSGASDQDVPVRAKARAESPPPPPAGATPTATGSAAPPREPAPTSPSRSGAAAPTVNADARPSWWLDAPVRRNGTFAATVSATAPTLREARQQAVERGQDLIRAEFGERAEGGGLKTTWTTSVTRLADAGYRVDMLLEVVEGTQEEPDGQ